MATKSTINQAKISGGQVQRETLDGSDVGIASAVGVDEPVGASPVYTIQTGLGSVDIWDDSDSYYYLTGAALFSTAVTNNSLVDLQAEISTREYSDNDNLSSEEIFLQGSYSYTPRAGFRVPTYSIALRYLEEFVSEDLFDASTLTLILSLAYRIDDRTNIRGGIKAGDRDSDSVKDSDISGYFVNLDFLYSPSTTYYTNLGFDEGASTVRSYCSGAYADESMWMSRARHNDNNFWNSSDSGYAGYDECENLYLTLGVNYAVNASNTLDFSVSYYDYETSVANFDGYIYALDYFFRF